MKYKVGSNQWKKKQRKDVGAYMIGFLYIMVTMFAIYDINLFINPSHSEASDINTVKVSPIAAPAESKQVEEVNTASPAAILTPTPTDDISKTDGLTGQAIDEFFTAPGERSHMRKLVHCLLYKEAKHNYSKGHGDSGLAGGPLQFHETTWKGYRKLMIAEGKAEEIGSRYDLKEALRTTVWAIKDGRGKAWGPILRGECN